MAKRKAPQDDQKLIDSTSEGWKLPVVNVAIGSELKAIFQKVRYGFPPGRSSQDAIGAIFNHTKFKAKFVLDADIKGCIDHIDQEVLLKKLHNYTALRHT